MATEGENPLKRITTSRCRRFPTDGGTAAQLFLAHTFDSVNHVLARPGKLG